MMNIQTASEFHHSMTAGDDSQFGFSGVVRGRPQIMPKFQFKRDSSVGAQSPSAVRPVSGSTYRPPSVGATAAHRSKSPFFFSNSHAPITTGIRTLPPRPRSVVRGMRDGMSTAYSQAPGVETNNNNTNQDNQMEQTRPKSNMHTPGRTGASMMGMTTMSRRTANEWNSIEDRLAKRAETIAAMTTKVRVPPELISQVETLRNRVERAREELARYNRELIGMGEEPVL
eukprot:GDKJ01012713.1.p1 GENE.GDKJ01012713.1~~GDKJ01012713.1.p1  ORF type:complete len:228 (-),score=32.16 GDKJ01012713.1:221-904(-)